jgi:hypothetical protein
MPLIMQMTAKEAIEYQLLMAVIGRARTRRANHDPPQVRHALRIWRCIGSARHMPQFGNSDDKITQAVTRSAAYMACVRAVFSEPGR